MSGNVASAAVAAEALQLHLDAGVTLHEPAGAPAGLTTPRGPLTAGTLSAGLRAALRALTGSGIAEDALGDLVLAADGAAGLPRLYYHLHRFRCLGLLRYRLRVGGEPLLTVVPMTGEAPPAAAPVAAGALFRLSRFAYLRRDGDDLVLESPRTPARLLLHGRRAGALTAALVQPVSAAGLSADFDWLAADAARRLLGLLAAMDVIAPAGAGGALAEDADAALRQWEFHDLLFHARSRLGRHAYPFGATYSFQGQLPPLPAHSERPARDYVPLGRPDAEAAGRRDLSLTDALEGRRSVREYGAQPITLDQLGEFLYRVARVRHTQDADPARGLLYAISDRPYPTGGAAYELELYVAANRCAGLAPGLYHYQPLAHRLAHLTALDPRVEALLVHAARVGRLTQAPQVLLIVASRFQRLSWKYATIAYALTLKHVGVLYQTMYLVATAMGLAPCALGVGDADLFAAAAGTAYYAETSVGEFLLGSIPDGAGPAAGPEDGR